MVKASRDSAVSAAISRGSVKLTATAWIVRHHRSREGIPSDSRTDARSTHDLVEGLGRLGLPLTPILRKSEMLTTGEEILTEQTTATSPLKAR